MNTRQTTKEYIKGKYFLFIVLDKSSNLSLFSVRRPQYFNSHTTSLLTVACNATPARSKVTFRLTEGTNVNYITPRNVSLGRLWCILQKSCKTYLGLLSFAVLALLGTWVRGYPKHGVTLRDTQVPTQVTVTRPCSPMLPSLQGSLDPNVSKSKWLLLLF